MPVDADRKMREIVEALRQKGVRVTPQRTEIIQVLCRLSHPGAGEILKRARERMPELSQSTVYYTLALLKKQGLVKELEFYDMENRYESEMTDHIDLICTGCGMIANFGRHVPATRELIRESTGFKAHRMRFEYYGLCSKCRGRNG